MSNGYCVYFETYGEDQSGYKWITYHKTLEAAIKQALKTELENNLVKEFTNHEDENVRNDTKNYIDLANLDKTTVYNKEFMTMWYMARDSYIDVLMHLNYEHDNVIIRAYIEEIVYT